MNVDEQRARDLDAANVLHSRRAEFRLPTGPDGAEAAYLAGNSLGLQPRRASDAVLAELEDWARLGVAGHHAARHP